MPSHLTCFVLLTSHKKVILNSSSTMQISQHWIAHVNEYLEMGGELPTLLQAPKYNPAELVS